MYIGIRLFRDGFNCACSVSRRSMTASYVFSQPLVLALCELLIMLTILLIRGMRIVNAVTSLD